jgi:hypothetical protein
MKLTHWFGLVAILMALVVAGCKDGATDKTDKTDKATATSTGTASGAPQEDADVKASLAKLSEEDQRLARSQKLCPVSDEPLGSMDVPIKLMIQEQPVFLCCKGCQKKALENPDGTLAKVKELKEKNAAPK